MPASTPAALEFAKKWWPNYTGGWDTLPGSSQEEALSATGGGGGATTSDYSPSSLASVFKQPAVTLPGAADAKQQLRDSQMGATRGLDALIARDFTADREGLRKAIYDPAAEEINYAMDRDRQAGFETMFGRNMGVSTATVDNMLAPLARERANSLERAGNNAFVSANTMTNQNRASEAQILGQAFNQGTTGLQAEANVENAQANRDQSATQAGYQTGLQREENQKNREQQATLQRESFRNAEKIASDNRTAAAIGGSLGGFANLFGPSLDRTMQRFGF